MAAIKTFRDLEVWRESHELVLSIYTITAPYPKHELFGLTSQTRRSAASIPANIVEGFRRKNLRDSISFYNRADASLEELKYHLLLGKDLMYLDEKTYTAALQKCETVGRLLTRWIQSQQKFLA